MSSPDATPYVDLTLYDKDPEDIFNDGIVNLLTYLPEWVPREGNTEVMLLESVALEVAQAVFALNRMPGAIIEVLLRLYGVDRDLGQPPTATVEFTLIDDLGGHVIPAGTQAVLQDVPGGEEAVVLSTMDAVVSASGSWTVQAAVVGDRATAIVNGSGAGTYIELLDSVMSIDRVELVTPLTGGSGPEDDDDWFARGATRFARLTDTLVVPGHFVAAALEQPNVFRATVLDNYNPGAGSGSPGSHPGHVTVAVYGGSGPLTAPEKSDLELLLSDAALAMLSVHVVDPSVVAVNVTATVVLVPGADPVSTIAAVEAALEGYLSPATWAWADTVYYNELISLIDRVPGVARVSSLAAPAADFPLTGGGVAPLASAGVLTITAV